MPAIADIVAEFLSELDDPAKWAIGRKPVPVFKPHERWKTRADGERYLAYRVTEDDLDEIAAEMRQAQESGTPARLTVGHVQPDPEYPETLQPEVIGCWLDAEVGTFGPKKEPCVLAIPAVRREYAAKAKGRPYRSAEYYHGPRLITGVALLSRDPELGMGTVDLADLYQGPPPDLYAMPGEFNMAETMPEAPKPAAPEDGEYEKFKGNMERYAMSPEGAHLQYAKECYAQSQEGEQPNPPPPAPPAPAPEHKPDLSSRAAARQPERTEPRSVPSPELYAMKQENKRLADQLEKLVKKDNERDCDHLIYTLEQVEGYQLDDDDRQQIRESDAAGRARMAGLIRKHGNKTRPPKPSDMVDVYQSTRRQAPGQDAEDVEAGVITPERSDKAIKLMRTKGLTWDDALAATLNGRK